MTQYDESKKVKLNLPILPQDVVDQLVEHIQQWEQQGETSFNKEKDQRLRVLKKSSLRAVALTCKSAHSLFFPGLLSDFSSTFYGISCLVEILKRDPEYGRFIKSIRTIDTHKEPLKKLDAYETKQYYKMLESFSRPSDPSKVDHNLLLPRMYAFILSKTSNLQRIYFYHNNIPLGENIRGLTIPFSFWASSLKTIVVFPTAPIERMWRARNVVWVMVFCSSLTQAVFSFAFDSEDFKYLSDYGETLQGRAKVKKLALSPWFVCDEKDRRTWWDVSSEPTGREWMGGNKKTEIVWKLLETTNSLSSLELAVIENQTTLRGGNQSSLYMDCLSGLHRSFNSLNHLRLVQCRVDSKRADFPHAAEQVLPLRRFKNLKILGINGGVLHALNFWSEIQLPPKMEVLHVVCYNYDSQSRQTDFAEESYLRSILERVPSTFKEVVVPLNPTRLDNQGVPSTQQRQIWEYARSLLGTHEVFKSGGVKLRVLDPEHSVGDASKDTNCLSFFDWIASHPL